MCAKISAFYPALPTIDGLYISCSGYISPQNIVSLHAICTKGMKVDNFAIKQLLSPKCVQLGVKLTSNI